MREPTPESPEAAGVAHEELESTSALEGAHLLANEARPRLHADRFNDTQIQLWANAFIQENHAGTVEDFIAWINKKEHLTT
jgi:hypothetical protein